MGERDYRTLYMSLSKRGEAMPSSLAQTLAEGKESKK